MNDVRTFATENPAVTSRAMEAVRARNGRAFSEAIHDAAATLQVAVGWHEADVLAEALSHHYTDIVQVYRVFDLRVIDDMVESELPHLREEMVFKADKDGLALVEKPTESWFATSSYPSEGQKFSTSHEAPRWRAVAMAQQQPGRFVVLVLSGKCRKLASAT